MGCATADGDYIVTSPNVRFIPLPLYGEVVVSMKCDGNFGIPDPIHWPQIFSPNTRYAWLSAIQRMQEPASSTAHTMWQALHPDEFRILCNSIVRTIGTVSLTRREAPREFVGPLYNRVAAFERRCGVNQELRHLTDSMQDAFLRLDYPSTFRDLVRQVAVVQRFWKMSTAWLEWHVKIWHNYVFESDPASHASHADRTRKDPMGAFTTDIDVVQKFVRAGIPVWFMRRPETLTKDDVVVEVVSLTEPCQIPNTNGIFRSFPLFTGTADELYLAAIA